MYATTNDIIISGDYRLRTIGVEYDGRSGHASSARMHYGAEASSPRQLSVKDSGKYICTEYEIMTISIKNNYPFRIFYE